jgi:hypothetical protein
MAVQLGKRYKDEGTGIELLVIKPGNCELKVNGKDMELMQPRSCLRPTDRKVRDPVRVPRVARGAGARGEADVAR